MRYDAIDKINSIISHFNYKKYWKYKSHIAQCKGSMLIRALKLMYLKRCDAFNCASLGHRLDRNGGSVFASAPFLPHGIKGIFVSDYAVIGSGAVIYQGVTIGNNVNVRANCVVYFDVPDNCTVVLKYPRVIVKKKRVVCYSRRICSASGGLSPILNNIFC